MSDFAIRKELTSSYDEALAKLPELLKAEGFGVLTEIDVKATLKKKIDVDFRRYQILGACNPKLAHQALESNLELGVLLPCNVIVYEDDRERAVLLVMDPMAMIASQPQASDALREVARTARQKLDRAVAGID